MAQNRTEDGVKKTYSLSITLSSCLPLYLPISPYDPQKNYHLENAYSVLQTGLST